MSNNPIDIDLLHQFLTANAVDEELEKLADILKCRRDNRREVFVRNIVSKLYSRFQTPLGNKLRKPTLDVMCDKIAKKLKLKKLEGEGWKKLHYLSINIFEKLLKLMPEDKKKKLLKVMWDKLNKKDREKLNKEFKIADLTAFVHSSEMMIAHVLGVYLAKETALYAAGTVVRILLSAELALVASKVLTRSVTLFIGPLGWVLVGMSVNDLMGTNFKRVVPALLTINFISMRIHETDVEQLFPIP